MNNFIFENATRTFFGEGCVREYLCCLASHYGENVRLCYGGGSIKQMVSGGFDTLSGSHRWGQNLMDSRLLSAEQNRELAPFCREENIAITPYKRPGRRTAFQKTGRKL